MIDLNVLWNKTASQVTVYATITDATLTALTDLLNPDKDGYHDTATPAPATNDMWAHTQPPMGGWVSHPPGRRGAEHGIDRYRPLYGLIAQYLRPHGIYPVVQPQAIDG